jgi:hypothetical protein
MSTATNLQKTTPYVYVYFVCFWYQKNNRQGFSNTDIVLSKPVSNRTQLSNVLNDLIQKMKKRYAFDEVTIVNFHYLLKQPQ